MIRTTTDYDRLDRIVRQTDPAGVAREVSYDANGEVETRTTVFPFPSEFPRVDETNAYDAADRLVRSENALGDAATFAYDPRGRLIQAVTALGHETRFEYDADGNRIAGIDPAEARWRWVYDVEGRLTQATDPLGQVSTTSYDAEGRVLKVTGPGGRTVATRSVDEVGNLIGLEDGEEFALSFVYDELGRRTEVSGPTQGGEPTAEHGVTAFAYDLEGRLVAETDPEGRSWSVRYDVLGRPVQGTDPLGRITDWVYDELGNLVERTNAAGETLRHGYDNRGLRLRTWSVGAPGGAEVDDTFAYDVLGRLVHAENAHATYRLAYDALDRPVALTDDELGTARRVYDADGRITQVVYPAHGALGFPGGLVTHYRYDARDQLISVTDPVAGTWQQTYDAAGRPVDRTYPGGLSHQTTYDAESFVARVEVFAGTIRRNKTCYENYDNRGYPATIWEGGAQSACSAGSGQVQLEYDSLGRLTQVSYPATSESFTYDKSGSRLQHVDVQSQVRQYVYDAGGQLEEITDGSGGLLESFTYDAAGRRESHAVAGGTTTTFAYDAAGRLRSVERPGEGYAATLAYDPAGYRRERAESGLDPTRYLGEWLEVRGGGTRFRLIHAPRIDDVMAEVEEPLAGDPIVRQLLADGAGHVVDVAVGSTLVVQRRFEAFGALRSETGSAPVERGYAGRPMEGATGLLYMRARHYDPATGQFLQPDPLGLATDHPYAYASGNPIAFRDPSGLLSIGPGLGGYGLGTGAGAGEKPITGDANPASSTLTAEADDGDAAATGTRAAIEERAYESGGAMQNHYALASGQGLSEETASQGNPAQNPFDPSEDPLEHQFWEDFPRYREDVEDARRNPLDAIPIDDWWQDERLRSIHEGEGYWSVRTTGSHDVDLRFGGIHLTYDEVGQVRKPFLHFDRVDPNENFPVGALGHLIIDLIGGPPSYSRAAGRSP